VGAKGSRAVAEPEVEKIAYPRDVLVGLYRMLVKCRLCDEKARILFRQGKYAGNFYSAVGQEATEVGAAYSLREDDWIAPSHRDWTANIIKGVPLKYCFAQLFAKATELWKVPTMRLVVDMPHESKRERRHEAMRKHQEHRPIQRQRT